MNDNSDSDFRDDDLTTSPARLVEDWFVQPEKVKQASRKLAEANSEVETLKLDIEILKEEVDSTDARLNLEIRRNATNRLTDAAVAASVLVHPEHAAVKHRYFDAKRKLNKAARVAALHNATVYGLANKKVTLEKLSDLLMGNFFALPKEARALRQFTEEQTQRDGFRRGAPRPREKT